MRKHNKKYRQIVETAKNLFWRYGIKRVTIEEICSVAEVSKMTFYKHFRNKNDLVKEILTGVVNSAISKYKDIIGSELPYPEKIEKMVLLKMEQTDSMSHEFINNYYSLDDPELNSFMKEMQEQTISEFISDIKKAQANGYVRKDLKPEFILYFLNHMTEMVTDPQLTSAYKNGQEVIMELINFLFYGISTIRTE